MNKNLIFALSNLLTKKENIEPLIMVNYRLGFTKVLVGFYMSICCGLLLLSGEQ
jgi:hypothetical protein